MTPIDHYSKVYLHRIRSAMKKILVDLSKIKSLHSGLGQFSAQFGKCLESKYAHEFEFHFLVPNHHELTFSPLIKEIRTSPLLKWWKASHEQYDLWHSLHQFPSYKPLKSVRQLLTIHDLNFMVEKSGYKRERYHKKLKNDIEQATSISTISKFTKSQIAEQYPDMNKPIQVIHNGVKTLHKIKSNFPEVVPNSDFFFSIGLFSAKKNFDVLLSMMKLFPNKKLLIAGNHDNAYGTSIKRKIQDLGLEQQVILPGVITDREKAALYQACEAFCFPSLAEGFGLPVIEAMQFGKPTFLSNKTSLPEIGGDAAFYFEHFDAEHMANLIKDSLTDFNKNIAANQLKVKDRAKQFTWDKSITQYVNLYRELLAV